MSTTVCDCVLTIDGVPVGPIFGGTAPNPQYGISVRGDALRVASLRDGTDLDAVWQLFQDALTIWKNERSSITDLLTFKTTLHAEAVPQNFNVGSFEQATEQGVPRSANVPGNALLMGYKFKDHDLAGRFSWRFLRDADRRQVDAVINGVLSADNKLTTGSILRAIFQNTRSHNEWGATVFDLYDGTAPGPPSYLGRTFPDTETHYIASQASQIDSVDIEDAIRLIRLKGYGNQPNSKILIFCNPEPEGEAIMSWRAGHASRSAEGSETEGPIAKYDFIPALDQPAFITPAGELVGEQVPGELWGVKVWGTYGPAVLVQSDFIPVGYVAVVASYGPDSPYNLVGFREHENPNYQGLRHIAGSGPYPITESFSTRAFGVGIRQRGAAVAVQVTTGSTYTPPSDDQIPI
jgi:hypothetical protein